MIPRLPFVAALAALCLAIFWSAAMEKNSASPRLSASDARWHTHQLAGLTLEAPGEFQNTPLDLGAAQEFVAGSEMQIAKTPGLEIDVLRTIYKDGVELNFDAAAQGAAEGIAHLDGLRHVEHTVTTQTVSGKPARRLAVTAERWRQALRIEALLISDGQTYYQVQTIFDPADQRAVRAAERLLQSVRIGP